MRHRRPHLLTFLVALLLTHTAANAQTVGGSISGIVRDETGGRIQGARVRAVHEETSVTHEASSDAAGRYRIAAVMPGGYRVEVVVPGFTPHTRRLQLAAGQHLTADVGLAIAGGREVVRVAASRLQRESAELSGVVGREAVLGLPVNGRSVEQLTLLEPGVVAMTTRETKVLYQHGLKININGAGSRSNAFLLDGTSVADLYNNGLGSAAGTFLGLEAVREFQVLTNAYQASLGGVAGGVVSIITRSGSHDVRGSAFGTFRDGRLDAKNFFDAEKPDFWRRQFGASLGGPLPGGRAVYFVTGEALRESMGLTQVTTVPSLAARNGRLADPAGGTVAVEPAVEPYLALFPLPNGEDFGDGLADYRFTAARPTRETFGQGRIDLDLGRGNTLFARYTGDQARKVEPASYPGTEVEWASRGRFLTIEDRQVLPAGVVNTARFSYSFTDLEQTDTAGRALDDSLGIVPGRGVPHLVIGGMPAFGSLVSPHTQARQQLLAFADDLAIARGPHLVRLGALAEHFDALIDFQIFWAGRYTFPNVQRFLQGRPSVLSVALPGSESARSLTTTQVALYAQDDMKLRPDLTVTAGLRWEFATAPREAQGRLVALPDPLRDTEPLVGELLRTRKANLAPRVGIAWSVNAGTVVRGGAGVYYDINTLPFIAQTVSTNPPFYNQVTVRNATFPAPHLPSASVLSLGVPQYDWRTPRIVQFNAAVERSLPGDSTLTVAYAGSRGTHVVRAGDVNAPVPVVEADGTRVFVPGSPRRNAAFGAIDLRAPDGRSWYDALQVKLARRFDGRFQAQASYTLARATDLAQGTVPTESNGSVTARMDPDVPETDRGPADFDRRHNLTAYVLWQGPALGGRSAWMRRLAGGWSATGILSLRSGTPFTVGIQENHSGTLARVSVDRPDLRPGVDPGSIVLGGPDQYFDPTAFVLPRRGTFGNVGRNSLTGPGLATLDVELTKSLLRGLFRPGGRVELRLAAFNLFNRPNFGMPQRIVFAGLRQDEAPLGSAGRITSTTTGPRELQLTIRSTW